MANEKKIMSFLFGLSIYLAWFAAANVIPLSPSLTFFNGGISIIWMTYFAIKDVDPLCILEEFSISEI